MTTVDIVIYGLMLIMFIAFVTSQLYEYKKINKKYNPKSKKVFYEIPNKGASKVMSIIVVAMIFLPIIIALIIDENMKLHDILYGIFMMIYCCFLFLTLNTSLNITEAGIALKANLINQYNQFFPWEDIAEWYWNNFDDNLLCIKYKTNKYNNLLERKIKSNREEINELLIKYIPEKRRIS